MNDYCLRKKKEGKQTRSECFALRLEPFCFDFLSVTTCLNKTSRVGERLQDSRWVVRGFWLVKIMMKEEHLSFDSLNLVQNKLYLLTVEIAELKPRHCRQTRKGGEGRSCVCEAERK